MDDWSEIRRLVLVEGVSRREILRERKMHWRTLQKILEHAGPPGYRQGKPRAKRKLGEYLGRIEQILKEDQAMPETNHPNEPVIHGVPLHRFCGRCREFILLKRRTEGRDPLCFCGDCGMAMVAAFQRRQL